MGSTIGVGLALSSDNAHQPARGRVARMAKHLTSVGYGLLAAGVVLVALIYVGIYVRDGFDGLADAMRPWRARNYLITLAVAPGFILVWLGRKVSGQ
jgi:hypothetical protein